MIAVLHITEADREQVTAIQKVQDVLDKLGNWNRTEIVFKIFRQIMPLQIGISSGKDVLKLLDVIGNIFNGDQYIITNELKREEEEWDI
jgi:DNA relaxase NicK